MGRLVVLEVNFTQLGILDESYPYLGEFICFILLSFSLW